MSFFVDGVLLIHRGQRFIVLFAQLNKKDFHFTFSMLSLLEVDKVYLQH